MESVLFDIGHPGHVHLYKNLIIELKKLGYQVYVTVKDIPVAKQLLTNYNIDFIDLGSKKDSLIMKGVNQLIYDYDILKIVRKNKIKFGVGSSITLPHISKITKMKSFVFDDDDDEVEPLFVKYAHPFCDYLLSPDVLKNKRRKKNTIYYPGYHELAYLHPNRFTPDSNVLEEAGLKPGEPFFIMRFNVFKAHHDIGIQGLTIPQKLKIIDILKPFGRIFITTERETDPELLPYKLTIAPEKAHSLIAFSTMFLGDSQTMTSEAAVLGIPSFRYNSFVGRIAYLEEEEHKYGLTFGYLPGQFDQMLQKINEILAIPDFKEKWQQKRQKLLNDKIDTTSFMVWFVTNFPKSLDNLKRNPDYPLTFKS
jgi:uncharacterized protein